MIKFLSVSKIKNIYEAGNEVEEWTLNINDIRRVEPINGEMCVVVLGDKEIYVSGPAGELSKQLRACALS